MRIMISILIYIVVCLISITLPASEGYDTVLWKFLIGQIYAIPALIIANIIYSLYLKKNKKDS